MFAFYTSTISYLLRLALSIIIWAIFLGLGGLLIVLRLDTRGGWVQGCKTSKMYATLCICNICQTMSVFACRIFGWAIFRAEAAKSSGLERLWNHFQGTHISCTIFIRVIFSWYSLSKTANPYMKGDLDNRYLWYLIDINATEMDRCGSFTSIHHLPWVSAPGGELGTCFFVWGRQDT